MALDLDQLTEIKDSSLFKLELMQVRSQEKNYDVQMEVTIEMNLNLTMIVRQGYTILDVLSDVGGI